VRLSNLIRPTLVVIVPPVLRGDDVPVGVEAIRHPVIESIYAGLRTMTALIVLVLEGWAFAGSGASLGWRSAEGVLGPVLIGGWTNVSAECRVGMHEWGDGPHPYGTVRASGS